MDVFSFMTPPTVLTIYLSAIVLVMLAYKLSADVREIRRSRSLYKKLIEIAKKASRKSISVVIELNQGADKLIPLLDNLHAENYPKLEVIIVIKHTAGRAARSKLKYYRQKNQFKKLRLIKHVKGLSMADVIKKYTSGYLIVPLTANSKLSNHFLDDVSINSLSSDREVMAIKAMPALGNSLTSAMIAHFDIWQTLVVALRPKKVYKFQLGFAYKRPVLKGDKIYQGLRPYVAHRAAIMVVCKTVTTREYIRKSLVAISNYAIRWYVLIALALTLIGLTALFLAVDAQDSRILAAFMLIAYTVAHIGLTRNTKIYSVQDRVSLALLAPFAFIAGVVLIVATPIKGLMDIMISLWPKKRLQNRFNNNN